MAQLSLLGAEHDPADLAQTSQVYIDYTNYRGERSVRLIEPLPDGLFFGANEYHPQQQWLLRAVDVEKKALRTFALRDVHGWDVNSDGTPRQRA
jgi:predicted DNA-binding transcriptional regulator YafY